MCFVAGLGLSAHWPLYVANAPVFLLLLSPLVARKKLRARLLSPKTIIGGAAILMLGLSPYLYLWLRPMFPPTLSLFPPPSNIAEVAAYIARDVYAAKDGVGGDWRQCADSALWSLRLLLTEHALLGGAMAAAGAFCFIRRRPPLVYAAAIFFGALATGPILTAMLCPNTASEFARAIFLPYPLPAMMFLLILVAELLRRLPSRACIVLTAALPLAAAAANWHDNNRSDDRLASEFARAVLQSLPPDATFVLSSDYDFPLFYHHHALGERPDIRLVREIPEIGVAFRFRKRFCKNIVGGIGNGIFFRPTRFYIFQFNAASGAFGLGNDSAVVADGGGGAGADSAATFGVLPPPAAAEAAAVGRARMAGATVAARMV